MMEHIPWLAFALALAGTGATWWDRPWAKWLLTAAVGVASIVFLWLLAAFLVADVSLQYVFLYTHAELPLRFRIAGTWAGREGSLALWALLGIGVAAWAAHRWQRDDAHRWSLVFLGGIATALLGAVAASNLFAPTDPFFLQQRPLGNGLNPTLQSDFFLIHPPMMFLAYALTAVPAAAALGHMVTGSGRWSRMAEPASRFDWLLYTAAMGLGGVWAYYTLGFGGFWAWDPVEVANLLPWLALTLYLHAQRHHARHGRYGAIGPFLALLPFLLTVFSTLSTRSGLWVSVHAFTDPTQTFNPDAVGRFQDILAVEPSLAFHAGLLMTTMFLGLALWARRLALDHGRFHRTARITAGVLGAMAVYAAIAPASAYAAMAQAGFAVGLGRTGMGLLILAALAVLVPALPALTRDDGGRTRLDVQGLNYAAVLVLGGGLLVLWLWHMAAADGWSTSFYESRLPFLAAPAMLAMLVFMGLPWGRRRALAVAGASFLVAGIVTLVADAKMAYLVLAAILVLAAMDRTRRAAEVRASWSHRLLAIGAGLNVLFWLNPPTTLLGGIVPGLTGRWPMQLLAVPAVWAWHRSLQHLAGRPGAAATRWLVAALGGYYVAPALALASRLLDRRRDVAYRPARMRQAGLYAIHLAVAIALLGYGSATYLAGEDQGTVAGSATLAGIPFQHNDTTAYRDGGLVDRYILHLDTPDGALAVPLQWEPTAGAYYPLPATLRTWDRDLFVAIDRICLQPCDGALDEVAVFQPTPQRAEGAIAEVDLTVHVLPGLGLVWAALAWFVHGMALLMADRPRPAQSGIALSTGDST